MMSSLGLVRPDGPIGASNQLSAALASVLGAPAALTFAIAGFGAGLIIIATPATAAPPNCDDADAEASDVARSADEDGDGTSTIVVTASHRGEALVNVETELMEEDISLYAADSVQQLLARIAPEIDGTGELPEVVINGKRIDPAIVKAFPPDALERLAILDTAAAARYGFDPGKRVVNLVLKPNYASWSGKAALSQATRGGRRGEQIALGRFLIADGLQWNVHGSATRESSLLEAERDLSVRSEGQRAASIGLDPQRFATLLPSSTSLSMSSGVTHPVGDFSATFGLNATTTKSDGLLGLVPAEIGSASGMAIEAEPLRTGNSSRTLSVRAGLSGTLAGWRTNMSLDVGKSWTESQLDRPGPDPAYGRVTAKTEGTRRTLGVRIDANRDVLSLPAGAAGLAISLRGDASSSTTTRTSSDRAADRYDAKRRTASFLTTLDLPVANRRRGVFQPLGDLAIELGASMETAASSPPRWALSAAGTWSPVEPLRLRVTYDYEQRLPTFAQLNAPVSETVDRVFDFARGEIAEVAWITGGNPALSSGSTRRFSIDAVLRPLNDQALTFDVRYSHDRKVGGIGILPGFTPAVEATFPERFVRDDEGRLVAVDARQINVASQSSKRLTAGTTARWSGNGPNPMRINLTLSYRRNLEDTVVTDRSIAPFDRLDQGASSRERAALQVVARRHGIGVTLRGKWTGAARIAGVAGFRYAPTALVDLELVAEPEQLWGAERGWANDAKVSLDVSNLFNGYRRVTTQDGATAPGFERDGIDPLGPTVTLSVTKRF